MKKEFHVSEQLRKPFMLSAVLVIITGILCFARGVYLLIFASDPVDTVLFLLIGLLQFLSAWSVATVFNTTRLVIDSETLEFHSPGLTLTTTWDNLERIGSMSTLTKSIKYDTLVLRSATIQKTAWWFKLLRKNPEHEIPMSMFSKWRVSEIGQEVRKYAPHLFSDHDAGK